MVWAAALVAGLPLALALVLPGRPVRAEGGTVRPEQVRPAGLVLLQERLVVGGKQAVGVYGRQADPSQPGVWRIKVWDELPNNVRVRSETIRCTPAAPMRVTSDGANLVVRELNPGGQISPANRLDHLIWWATCHPQQAGRDPATLAQLARQLGYSGHLPEREQILPGAATMR